MNILKEFGRGQITLPKKWRERFNTSVYIAKDTSQGLLIIPLEDESIQVDESRLKEETSSRYSTSLFKRKTIRKGK